MEQKQNKMIWITKTNRIDVETGEVITKEKATTEYTKIKTHKKIKKDGKKYGNIEYTIEYRRKPKQQTIW